MHHVLRLMVTGVLLALSATAAAQAGYPNKQIRFLVASPPGGSPDILARIVGARLSEQLKQQVIIDN